MFSGVPIAAAGVVPYVNLPGRGVHFLLQQMQNGTRMGKLCDFGGRREPSDEDAFVTAAREFCEETDYAFGDVDTITKALRTQAKVRILNRSGKYVTFFLKVPYCNARMLPDVDASSDCEPVARECKWWRADELMSSNLDDSQLLARMVPDVIGYAGSSGAAAARDGGASDGPNRPKPLSPFHKAVCKTLTIENANPMAHERWHATVLETLRAAEARRDADARAAHALDRALAFVEVTGGSTPTNLPKAGYPSRATRAKAFPNGHAMATRIQGASGQARSSHSGGAADGGSGALPEWEDEARGARGGGGGGGSAELKRGSRRGPPRAVRRQLPDWQADEKRRAKLARLRTTRPADHEWELPWPNLDEDFSI